MCSLFDAHSCKHCQHRRLLTSSDSLNYQKEIELGFIWIWNEAQVNFNRATRKLCLSLKPVWTEAYFNGKWSLLQWQMKLISSADEAYLVYCISKIVRDKTKIVRDAWGINAPFLVSVTHVASCLSITYPVSSWKSWCVIDDLAKIYSPSAPFLSLFLFCFNTTCIILLPFALKLLFNLVLVTRVDASPSESRCKDTAFFRLTLNFREDMRR